jgi:hypothetical protein
MVNGCKIAEGWLPNTIPIQMVFARAGRAEPHEGVHFLADPDQGGT